MGVISCSVNGCTNIGCTYQLGGLGAESICLNICDECRQRFERQYLGKVYSPDQVERALIHFSNQQYMESYGELYDRSREAINEVFGAKAR